MALKYMISPGVYSVASCAIMSSLRLTYSTI